MDSLPGEAHAALPRHGAHPQEGARRRTIRFTCHMNESPQQAERKEMARVTGLEPATSGVTGRHSNRLSYTRILESVRVKHPSRAALSRSMSG